MSEYRNYDVGPLGRLFLVGDPIPQNIVDELLPPQVRSLAKPDGTREIVGTVTAVDHNTSSITVTWNGE